jgi:SAM-dependent methyltransferase
VQPRRTAIRRRGSLGHPGELSAAPVGTTSTASLRWEATEAEWAAAHAVRGDWSMGAALGVLSRAPRLLPHVAALGLRAAVHGVWNDVELSVLLDSERVRQALPGTVRGAAWSPEEAFLDALLPRLDPASRVLEIGCGVGRIARRVAPKVRELVCSDISRVMIGEARANLAEHPNVRFVQTRGYWLESFPDASFDLAYSHAVFSFFDLLPMVAMLDATRRVLRVGGTCVLGFLTMDRPEWAKELVELARGGARFGTFGGRSVRRYTEAQIRATCEAVGIEVVDTGYRAGDVADLRPHLIVVGQAT